MRDGWYSDVENLRVAVPSTIDDGWYLFGARLFFVPPTLDGHCSIGARLLAVLSTIDDG